MTRPSRARRSTIGRPLACITVLSAVATTVVIGLTLTSAPVSAAAADDTPTATFVAAPDYLNTDYGDLSALPNWTPDVGNSLNQSTEDSITKVLGAVAAKNPDAFLVTGDLVDGHWGLPDNNTGVFGDTATTADQLAMVTNEAELYYGAQKNWLVNAGLWDEFYPAIGDHDIGDNDWARDATHINPATGVRWSDFKRDHAATWRDAFFQDILSDDGTWKFARGADDALLAGSPWQNTAYSTRIGPDKDTLLVTVDVFKEDDANTSIGADIGVYGQQLTWLDKTLSDARQPGSGIKWIIVQGHAPVLPARLFHSSGLHVEGGQSSGLWQTMKKYHANLYLAGEVHTTSTMTRDGITQLVTGAPLNTNEFAYATIKTYSDHMTVSVDQFQGTKSLPADVDHMDNVIWQGGCSASSIAQYAAANGILPANYSGGLSGCSGWSKTSGATDYSAAAPVEIGSLTIGADNVSTDDPTSDATGVLQPWDTANIWGPTLTPAPKPPIPYGSPSFTLTPSVSLTDGIKVGQSVPVTVQMSGGDGSNYQISILPYQPSVLDVSSRSTSVLNGHTATFSLVGKKAGRGDIQIRVCTGLTATGTTSCQNMQQFQRNMSVRVATPLAAGAPQSRKLIAGDKATYSVRASGGLAPVSYRAQSANPAVATGAATADGHVTITAKSAGKTTVTVTARDAIGQTARTVITVSVAPRVELIPAPDSKATVRVGSRVVKKMAARLTGGTGSIGYRVSSSNGRITAHVDRGNVTIRGVRAGTATVTVTASYGGKTVTSRIRVTVKPRA